jgi:hypothetical protein
MWEGDSMTPTLSSSTTYKATGGFAQAAAGVVRVSAGGTSMFASGPQGERHGVPVMLPKAQLYYWTAQWQAEEQAAAGEIAAGDVRVFKTSADAVRWLLDPEDD